MTAEIWLSLVAVVISSFVIGWSASEIAHPRQQTFVIYPEPVSGVSKRKKEEFSDRG